MYNKNNFKNKNNFIIERFKNGWKIRSVKDSDQSSTCSVKSIAFKTFLLFCLSFLSCIFTHLIFNYWINKTVISKITKLYYIKRIMVCCIVAQIAISIATFFSSLKHQKKISISMSIIDGISIYFFFYLLNYHFYNVGQACCLAIVATAILFMSVHLIYKLNIIKVNRYKWRMILFACAFTLILTELIASWVLKISYKHPLYLFLIGGSLFFASITLLRDFDDMNTLVSYQIHKDHEWIIALGFYLNIIYIFINIIRLLMATGFLKERES
ncbi:hypothetical protein DH96_01685 [Candidatus Phytoplasma oryzae]|uniref:Inhibitor of apoptosis-promoting Bax1 family protein n=1 Tax=Candidatus Phytoplasma oryzae TaxID=203274 RepID=A0A328IHR4_9MOLU|nr:Bax inhibitor-1/YccA family protein [Candidatus Phytoplasma oryzae]RAM57792.1 hypothetical protein DH96_01685 [Candidatus Phytoplasma oryzae]